MLSLTRRLALALLALSISLTVAPAIGHAQGSEQMILEVEGKGQVTIQLRDDLAPNHVARITELANSGFYDGVVFHRVIDGFMAQTGDPTGTGRGGSDLPDLRSEFSPASKASFGRGTIGMARTSDPHSANSQFFICFSDCSFLDGQYTIWGQVSEGMDVVDAITKGEPPANPDKIARFRSADQF